MKLEQILYTLEAYKSKSMNKAAKKLFITQPSLSTTIKSFEYELGFEVFKRGPRGVEITDKGLEVVKYAQIISDNINSIQAMSNVENDSNIVALKLSGQILFSHEILSNLYNKYSYTKTSFNFRQGNCFDAIDDLVARNADLAVVAISDMQQSLWYKLFNANNIEFSPISNMKLYFCLLDNHPLYNKCDLCIDDLYDYPLIKYIDNESRHTLETDIPYEDKYKNTISVPDYSSLLNMMYSMNGVSFLYNFDDTDIGITNNYNYNIKTYEVNNSPKLTFGWLKLKDTNLNDVSKDFISDLYNYYSS